MKIGRHFGGIRPLSTLENLKPLTEVDNETGLAALPLLRQGDTAGELNSEPTFPVDNSCWLSIILDNDSKTRNGNMHFYVKWLKAFRTVLSSMSSSAVMKLIFLNILKITRGSNFKIYRHEATDPRSRAAKDKQRREGEKNHHHENVGCITYHSPTTFTVT